MVCETIGRARAGRDPQHARVPLRRFTPCEHRAVILQPVRLSSFTAISISSATRIPQETCPSLRTTGGGPQPMSPWRGHHDPTWDHASRRWNLVRTYWVAPSPTSRSRWTGCSCRIETPECYQIEFCTKSGSARRRGRARLTRRQIVHPCSGYKTKKRIRAPTPTRIHLR